MCHKQCAPGKSTYQDQKGRQGLVLSPKQSPLVCSFGQAKQAKEQCSKPKPLQTPQNSNQDQNLSPVP